MYKRIKSSGDEMATRILITFSIFCVIGSGVGVVNLQADETQESPIILTDPFTWKTVIPSPSSGGSDAPIIVFRGRMEGQGEARTEKGLLQPPRKLLDKFPTLIIKTDSGKNYHGVLLNVDPGTLYSMPMLDEELFDKGGESSRQRILIDNDLFKEPQNVPKRLMKLPDGSIHIFHDN